MADPFIGEIRMFTGNYAPQNWALCNGQTLPINQNQALFSILGVTYGGDGVTNFQLPNLQGRVPVHPGSGTGLSPYTLGQAGGNETVQLTSDQLAPHLHGLQMPVNNTEAGTADPTGAYLSTSGNSQYATEPTAGAFGPSYSTQAAGSGNGHTNIQPYQCVNFIISLTGIYPPRS